MIINPVERARGRGSAGFYHKPFWFPVRSVYFKDGKTNSSLSRVRRRNFLSVEEAQLIDAGEGFAYSGKPKALVVSLRVTDIPKIFEETEGEFIYSNRGENVVITSLQVGTSGPAFRLLFTKCFNDFGYLHCNEINVFSKGYTNQICRQCMHKNVRMSLTNQDESCSSQQKITGGPKRSLLRIYDPVWGYNMLDEDLLERDNKELEKIVIRLGGKINAEIK